MLDLDMLFVAVIIIFFAVIHEAMHVHGTARHLQRYVFYFFRTEPSQEDVLK